MALNLLHGPAGSGKSSFILQKIARDYLAEGNLNSFFWVVPSQHLAQIYEKKILESVKAKGLFIDDAVLPFNRFLFRLIKLNKPRVHLAALSLCRNLIRALVHTKKYASFAKDRTYPALISELFFLINQLKKNGFDSEQSQKILLKHSTPEIQDMNRLLKDYETWMIDHYYYDEGNLLCQTLALLKRGNLKIPAQLKAVYFDRLFPLSPGQREWIYQFSKNFPHLEITVSYSFDYATKDDPYFYPAYSFLGEIAQQSEYFHFTNLNQNKSSLSFSDPAKECEWVANEVLDLKNHGYASQEIGIVLPTQPFYVKRLAELCDQSALDFHSFIPRHPLCLNKSPPLQKSKQIVDLFREVKTLSLKNTLADLEHTEQFENQWEFEQKMLFHEISDAPTIETWKQDELSRFVPSDFHTTNGISFFSMDQAFVHDFKFLFVLGFTKTNYPRPAHTHPFFKPELLFDPLLREIFEGPAYHTGQERNYFNQLLNRTECKVTLTWPKIYWDGEVQAPSRLWNEGKRTRDEGRRTKNDAADTLHLPPTPYPHPHLKTHSLSGLETYQKCPYQYYARYHLNLGKKMRDELEIPGDVRGSFVHRVLDRVFKNYLHLYEEAIEYDLYIIRLSEAVFVLTRQLLKEDAFLSVLPTPSRVDFENRVSRVLSELLKNEVHEIRDGKKTTRPRYFEWAFGRGNTPALVLRHHNHEIWITGRMDRIDVDDEKKIFTVIDYKTGELGTASDIKSGQSLQIPLYLMAAGQLLLKNYTPACGLLVSLKELNKRSGFFIRGAGEEKILSPYYGLSAEEWQELQKNVLERAVTLSQQMKQGVFDPKPASLQLCRVCDYRDICHYHAAGC